MLGAWHNIHVAVPAIATKRSIHCKLRAVVAEKMPNEAAARQFYNVFVVFVAVLKNMADITASEICSR